MLEGAFTVSDLRGQSFPDVEEIGTTFLENATLKAVEISKLTDGLVLSDDSGLEVDALGGDPGVYSARYAGVPSNDAANNSKLLTALSGLPASNRTARFRCVMVIAQAGQRLAHFSGSVEGTILTEAQGANGFGYDPLFLPTGYDCSFAELAAEEKNRISHRANALQQVIQWLKNPLPHHAGSTTTEMDD